MMWVTVLRSSVRHVLLLMAVAALPLTSAMGQTIYKYVDENGEVVYSETPPPDNQPAETVEVEAGPSAASQKQAADREQQVRDAAAQTRSASDERAAKADDSKAQQQSQQDAVAAAEAALERARVVGPGDRIGTAGGGNKLRESYHERVRAAEEELRKARQAAR